MDRQPASQSASQGAKPRGSKRRWPVSYNDEDSQGCVCAKQGTRIPAMRPSRRGCAPGTKETMRGRRGAVDQERDPRFARNQNLGQSREWGCRRTWEACKEPEKKPATKPSSATFRVCRTIAPLSAHPSAAACEHTSARRAGLLFAKGDEEAPTPLAHGV